MRSANSGAPMRFCEKPQRFSRRRSSTAGRGDGALHRRTAEDVWGRADLCGGADRPGDLCPTPGVARASGATVAPGTPRCLAHARDPAGLGHQRRRRRSPHGLAAAHAGRHRCGARHGAAIDASHEAAGRGPRAHVQDDDRRSAGLADELRVTRVAVDRAADDSRVAPVVESPGLEAIQPPASQSRNPSRPGIHPNRLGSPAFSDTSPL